MGSRWGVGVEDVKEAAIDMPSFVPSIGAAGNNMHGSLISGFGALEQSMGFRIEAVADLSRNPLFDPKSGGQALTSDPIQFSSFTNQLASTDITPTAARASSVTLPQQKEQQSNLALSGTRFENWGETTMAAASPSTDTSTDIDTEDKNLQLATIGASDSSDRSKDKRNDQKILRRLAQNREAARKSRLRKKGRRLRTMIPELPTRTGMTTSMMKRC